MEVQIEDVLGKIKQLVADYNSEAVEIIPGQRYSQRDTLRRIEYYYAGKFLSGDKDDEGFQKFFYLMGAPRCDVASKAIDLDTKDLKIESEDKIKAWLMGKDLKQWAKENHVGKFLNDIIRDLPIYGTVVVKSIKGKNWILDLKNLINDQTAPSLEESNVIEKHIYTPEEFKSEASKRGWDNVSEVLAMQTRCKDPNITVYESYLWMPLNDDMVRHLCIAVGLNLDINRINYRKQEPTTQYISLYLKSNPKFPYKECHWDRIKGRWLGRGLIEKLFDVQESVNDLMNTQRKGFTWTSKKLWQTRDVIAQKNLLTDALNGDVVNTTQPIEPIAMEDRNLPAFESELTKWESLADRLCFSFEVATGASLPSGTPFRLAFIQQQSVGSFFELKREDIGIFLRELFLDLIIPAFKQDRKKQHSLMVYGGEDELMIFREGIAEELMRQQIKILAPRIKYFEELDLIKQQFLQKIGSKIPVQIPDSLYEDVEYSIDMVITDEQVDSNTKSQSLSTAMQIYGANPNIVRDPIGKKLFAASLDQGGLDSTEILAGAELMQAPAQPVAGSVAKQQPNDIASTISKTTI